MGPNLAGQHIVIESPVLGIVAVPAARYSTLLTDEKKKSRKERDRKDVKSMLDPSTGKSCDSSQ